MLGREFLFESSTCSRRRLRRRRCPEKSVDVIVNAMTKVCRRSLVSFVVTVLGSAVVLAVFVVTFVLAMTVVPVIVYSV